MESYDQARQVHNAPRECCYRPKHPKSQCISSVCSLFLSVSSDMAFRIQRNSGPRKGG